MTTTLNRSSYRDPYELPQLPMSCMSNVTAQARWILGLSDTQGPDAITEVDRLVGRDAGQHAEPHACLTLLAREGCRIEEMTDFDLDKLRAGGVDYVRSRRKPGDWTDEDEAYLTPERMAAYLRRAEQIVRDREATLGRYDRARLVQRRPVFDDFARMLDDGMLVIAMVAGSNPGTSHAVLIYGRHGGDGDLYRMYSPRRDGATLRRMGADSLQQRWLGESLVGVGV